MKAYQIHWDSNDARFDIGEGMIVTDIDKWEENVIDYVVSHADKFQEAYEEDNICRAYAFPTIRDWAKWCIFNFNFPTKVTIDDYKKYFT